MSVAELGAVIAVIATIGGIVAKAVAGVKEDITASERRLEAKIGEVRTAMGRVSAHAAPKADVTRLQRKTRAIEGFLIKNFSVDLERFDMD